MIEDYINAYMYDLNITLVEETEEGWRIHHSGGLADVGTDELEDLKDEDV